MEAGMIESLFKQRIEENDKLCGILLCEKKEIVINENIQVSDESSLCNDLFAVMKEAPPLMKQAVFGKEDFEQRGEVEFILASDAAEHNNRYILKNINGNYIVLATFQNVASGEIVAEFHIICKSILNYI